MRGYIWEPSFGTKSLDAKKCGGDKVGERGNQTDSASAPSHSLTERRTELELQRLLSRMDGESAIHPPLSFANGR